MGFEAGGVSSRPKTRAPRKLVVRTPPFNTYAQVEYPRYLSEASVSFVSALLRHEVEDRLGSGATGKQDIKSHAFMAGTIDIDHGWKDKTRHDYMITHHCHQYIRGRCDRRRRRLEKQGMVTWSPPPSISEVAAAAAAAAAKITTTTPQTAATINNHNAYKHHVVSLPGFLCRYTLGSLVGQERRAAIHSHCKSAGVSVSCVVSVG